MNQGYNSITQKNLTGLKNLYLNNLIVSNNVKLDTLTCSHINCSNASFNYVELDEVFSFISTFENLSVINACCTYFNSYNTNSSTLTSDVVFAKNLSVNNACITNLSANNVAFSSKINNVDAYRLDYIKTLDSDVQTQITQTNSNLESVNLKATNAYDNSILALNRIENVSIVASDAKRIANSVSLIAINLSNSVSDSSFSLANLSLYVNSQLKPMTIANSTWIQNAN